MNLQKLIDATVEFNRISGQEKETSLHQLHDATAFVVDEAIELKEANLNADYPEMLKEALDVIVTAVGVLQRLKNLGYDVEHAADVVGQNNLSKFTQDREVVMQTITDRLNKNLLTRSEQDAATGLWMLRDAQSGKILKPINYQKINSAEVFTRSQNAS